MPILFDVWCKRFMLVYVCKKLFLPVVVLLVTSVIPGTSSTVAAGWRLIWAGILESFWTSKVFIHALFCYPNRYGITLRLPSVSSLQYRRDDHEKQSTILRQSGFLFTESAVALTKQGGLKTGRQIWRWAGQAHSRQVRYVATDDDVVKNAPILLRHALELEPSRDTGAPPSSRL